MTRSRILIVAVLASAVITLAVAGAAMLVPARQAGAQATFELALDCDASTATIDASCPGSTDPLDMAVVLVNHGGVTATLASFNFEVVNYDTPRFVASPATADILDSNPDFNQADLGTAWQCLPAPSPDDESPDNPNTQHSFLSCFTGTGVPIAPGSALRLAVVHYVRPTLGSAVFDLANVDLADPAGNEYLSCNPIISQAGDCTSTGVGAQATRPTETPTPSNTATVTPTPTPSDTATPVMTPTPTVGLPPQNLAYFDRTDASPAVQGRQWLFDGSNSTIVGSGSDTTDVEFLITGTDGPFHVSIGAADGGRLTLGAHEGALPFRGSQPYLYVTSPDGPCFGETGRFVVEEIQTNADGGVTSFAGTFQSDCASPAFSIFGDIRFHTGRPLVATLQSTPSFDFGSVSTGDDNAKAVTITSQGSASLNLGSAEISGVDTADFSIQDDSCSGRALGLNESCSLTVHLIAHDDGAKRATLRIRDNSVRGERAVAMSAIAHLPGATTAVYFDGDPGNFATFGSQQLVSSDVQGTAAGVSANLYSSAPPPGSLRIAAPAGELLHLGTYVNATTAPVAGRPTLYLQMFGRYCPNAVSEFVIEEIVLNGDGSLRRFAASFESNCGGGLGTVAPLFGEVRLNSQVPLPAVRVSAQRLTFDGVDALSDVAYDNIGEVPVAVGVHAILGDGAAAFSVEADTCTGNPIPAGGSCALTIRYHDDGSPRHDAWLDMDETTLRRHRSLGLRGFGNSPLSGIQIVNPGICLAQSAGATEFSGCAYTDGLGYSQLGGHDALRRAADDLGDADGIVQPRDFAPIVSLGGAQIHQQSSPNAATNLAIIAYVPGSGPVRFHTTAGTFTASGGPDWTCTGDPGAGASSTPTSTATPAAPSVTATMMAFQTVTPTITPGGPPTDTPSPTPTLSGVLPDPDSDCGGPHAGDTSGTLAPDHAVVAYLSCSLTTCPSLGAQHIVVTQISADQTADFTVVGEPVRVELTSTSGTLTPTDDFGCDFTGEQLPSDLQSASLLQARAFDAAGTAITGAWFYFAVADPKRAIIQSPLWPSVAGHGSPVATDVVCVRPGVTAGPLQVTARLVRSAAIVLDPFADPGNPDEQNLASASTTIEIGQPSAATPTTIASTRTPAPTSTPGPGEWRKIADLPGTPTHREVATGVDGRIYSLGGFFDHNSAVAFDPARGTFDPIADPPQQVTDGAFTSGPDRRLFRFGGDPFSNDNETRIYDEVTNLWSNGAPMPRSRRSLAAALGGDGNIYVFGGSPNGFSDLIAAVDVYDPATDSWSSTAPMIHPRIEMGVATDGQGRIYAIGGWDGDHYLTSVERFDPASQTWTEVAPLPAPRVWPAGALGPDGRIYVIGGQRAFQARASVFIYDPGTDTWQDGPRLPRPDFLGGAGTVGGATYLLSGLSNDLLALAPATVATSPTPTASATATPTSAPTNLPTATETATAAQMATATASTTPTAIPTATVTPIASATASSTNTPLPTASPTSIPTSVRTASSTVAPKSTRTVVRTPGASPTALRTATRTSRPSPRATATPPASSPCAADLNHNGIVGWHDVLEETRAYLHHRHEARYDVNRDGRVDIHDVWAVINEVGRRCGQRR